MLSSTAELTILINSTRSRLKPTKYLECHLIAQIAVVYY